MEVASWLRQNTNHGDRIGSWNAGLLGYFSHRHVTVLDGLVGNAEFYRQVVRDRRIVGYLRTEHVNWLADYTRGLEITLSPFQASLFSPEALRELNREFGLVASFAGPDPAGACPAPGLAAWRRATP